MCHQGPGSCRLCMHVWSGTQRPRRLSYNNCPHLYLTLTLSSVVLVLICLSIHCSVCAFVKCPYNESSQYTKLAGSGGTKIPFTQILFFSADCGHAARMTCTDIRMISAVIGPVPDKHSLLRNRDSTWVHSLKAFLDGWYLLWRTLLLSARKCYAGESGSKKETQGGKRAGYFLFENQLHDSCVLSTGKKIHTPACYPSVISQLASGEANWYNAWDDVFILEPCLIEPS